MSVARLSDAEIAAGLATLPGWVREGEALVRTFDRGNFAGAIAFVNAIAAAADAADHHPDLAIAWNRVTARLTTHDAGGISQRDLDLAQALSNLAG